MTKDALRFLVRSKLMSVNLTFWMFHLFNVLILKYGSCPSRSSSFQIYEKK